jgi:hypothetical protein
MKGQLKTTLLRLPVYRVMGGSFARLADLNLDELL